MYSYLYLCYICLHLYTLRNVYVLVCIKPSASDNTNKHNINRIKINENTINKSNINKHNINKSKINNNTNSKISINKSKIDKQ